MDPDAPLVEAAPEIVFGNQFDFAAARNWRTVAVLAYSIPRKECMQIILAGILIKMVGICGYGKRLGKAFAD